MKILKFGHIHEHFFEITLDDGERLFPNIFLDKHFHIMNTVFECGDLFVSEEEKKEIEMFLKTNKMKILTGWRG